MARHLTITRTPGFPVYFWDSDSPWQRCSNENMIGLGRLPPGVDLHRCTADYLLAVENELNRPAQNGLNDRSPAELYKALPASQNPSVCGVTQILSEHNWRTIQRAPTAISVTPQPDSRKSVAHNINWLSADRLRYGT